MSKYDKSASGSGYKGSGGAGRSNGAGGDKFILKGPDVVTMQPFKSTTSRDDKVKFAEQFGPVKTITLPIDNKTKKPENFLFARYKNKSDAYASLQQSGKYEVDGRYIDIKQPNK